jgi:hypothetical protein
MPIPTSNRATTQGEPVAQGGMDQQGNTAPQVTGAGVDTGAGITRSKTDAEMEADRLYEERIEEEYAKREGGA